MLVVQGGTAGAGIGLLGPAPFGIPLSALGWAVVMIFPRARQSGIQLDDRRVAGYIGSPRQHIHHATRAACVRLNGSAAALIAAEVCSPMQYARSPRRSVGSSGNVDARRGVSDSATCTGSTDAGGKKAPWESGRAVRNQMDWSRLDAAVQFARDHHMPSKEHVRVEASRRQSGIGTAKAGGGS